MNDEMKALAQRAVASKHWRWMPGMLVKGGRFCRWNQGTVGRVKDNVAVVMTDNEDDEGWPADYIVSLGSILVDGARCWNMLPDLTEPATLGCLLHLVREAWESPDIFMILPGSYWRWSAPSSTPHWRFSARLEQLDCYQTEAEALVAALEAAS
jgi:hypothetical protein